MMLLAIQAAAQNATAPIDLNEVVFEANTLQQEGPGKTIVLSGNVMLDDGDRVLTAESLTLEPEQGYAAAQGNVQLTLNNGDVVKSNAVVLDQRSTTLLLSGLSVRLREEAILAAQSASVKGETIRFEYASYTACNAPCEIEEQRQRNPLPWRVTARSIELDQVSDTMHLRGLRLELFEWPVFAWPAITLPSPDVERRSGVLGPVAGYTSGEGAWAGLPLYLTLGPSADLTATPVLYTRGLTRFDAEARVKTHVLEGEIKGSMDADGRSGTLIDATQALSPTGDLSVNLDWALESEQGALHHLSQTAEPLHENEINLTSVQGHSFAALSVHQDRVLSRATEWLDLDWDEGWATRARFDWRAPPLAGGSRLRAEGQALTFGEHRLVETSGAWSMRAVTRGGLELTPLLQAGFVGNDTNAEARPWFGGQLGGAFPLIRTDKHATIRLAPKLVLSGLTGASVRGSPHRDAVVPSRSSLFDLRPTGDPFSHEPDLRLDAAIDFALYPHQSSEQGRPDFGLRGSLAQRLSWHDEALQPALGEVSVQTGLMKLDARAALNSEAFWTVERPAALWSPETWDQALPRLNIDLRLPVGPDVTVLGELTRLHTDDDQATISGLSLNLGLTDRLEVTAGIRTKQTRSNNSLSLNSAMSWRFTGDWVAETKIRQSILTPEDQDLSFDLFHRCDCLGLQLGVLREQRQSGTEYSARVALDLPTLFKAGVSPTVFRHR